MAKERIITGTCFWLAQKLDMDPTWVRVAFAAGVLLAGVGLGLYLVLWLVKILESN